MATAAKAKSSDNLVYARELAQDRETKGTFRYTAENELTGRDITLYIEKADFATLGMDAPTRIKVTVEVVA